jgi:peptidoglycan/LPS O-acetylase OafA/YrhL
MLPVTDNSLQMFLNEKPKFLAQFLYNIGLPVNTFFTLGAFLATYLMVESQCKRRNATANATDAPTKTSSWSWYGLTFLHRYLRLTPVYFVCILFFTYLTPLTTQGPYWKACLVSTISKSCLFLVIDTYGRF